MKLRGVYHYSTTHTSDAVYIIGGAHTGNIIAEFTLESSWRQLPDLKQPRSRHRSITMGSQMIIFGGIRSNGGDTGSTGTIATEVWDFETEKSETIAPMLSQEKYSEGIALYFVDDPKLCVEKSD